MANSPPTDVSPSRGLAGGEWGVGKWGEACPDELHFPSILAGARWHLEQPRLASLAELGVTLLALADRIPPVPHLVHAHTSLRMDCRVLLGGP